MIFHQKSVLIVILIGLAALLIYTFQPHTASSPRFIKGGIVPHHMLVGDVIGQFFHLLSAQKPRTLLLLGPNHLERGDFPLLVSLQDWKTENGSVFADKMIINTLLDEGFAKVDDETVSHDQSIMALMTYIHDYLPQVKIVPLVVKKGFTKEKSETLAAYLKKIISDEVILIASVDFSHYLSSAGAQANDSISLDIIKQFNYDQLYRLGSDYMDSPPSIGVLLMTMQNLGSTHMDILYHSNSGDILKNKSGPSTSYFSIVFN